MSAETILSRLGLATLIFTVLAGLLLLARRSLRARLGAEAVYALWLLLPLGLALCCWPAHRRIVWMTSDAWTMHASLPATLSLASSSGPQLVTLLVGIWLLGAAAGLLLLVRRQRAFMRSLGSLRRLDEDTWVGARSDAGPMLVGLLRPRIVLPADYAARYSQQELAAVLAHERLHRERGDLWWNALSATLRCVFWFHPLGAGAQRAYLADQELACDSAVLRLGVHAPRTYANALLNTQSADVPLGCAMQASSPLRERILNLGRRASSPRVRVLMALLLACAAAVGGRVAWAATAEVVAADDAASVSAAFKIALDVSVDGGPARHQDSVVHGTLHLNDLRDDEGRRCEADLMPGALPDNMIDVRLLVTCDGKVAATSRLIVEAGQPAAIAIGPTERRADGRGATTRGFRLAMTFHRL